MTDQVTLLGAFSPFHNGHLEIMKNKLNQGINLQILIKETDSEIPANVRKRMIENHMEKTGDINNIDVQIIDTQHYNKLKKNPSTNIIRISEHTKKYSTSEIRNKIINNDDTWKQFIPDGAKEVLDNYINSGFVVWLTGLPGSGKSTISKELEKKYLEHGLKVETMDGDEIRNGLSSNLGFSKEDRQEHARRVTFVSKLLARNGVAVNVALISPYKSVRENARSQIDNFIEVYVNTPLDVCMDRDPKGLYKKAKNGEINNLTGFQDTYEKPENPDIVINTVDSTPEEAADTIIDELKDIGYLPGLNKVQSL